MKRKKELKLRKTYKAVIKLPQEVIADIHFLSKCMIHFWNMAHEECERRLAARRVVKMAIESVENAVSGEFVFDDAKEKRLFTIPNKEALYSLFSDLGITAISLNYWLILKRQQGENIKLNGGTTVKLSAISNDLEREVLRKLAGSYQAYFSLREKNDARARRPRPKEEDWFQTLSWSSFTVKNGVLYVSSFDKRRIQIPIGEYLARQISEKKIVHATLFRTREGAFELNLVTASSLPQQIERPMFFRAIDLGAGTIAVTDSDGSEFLIPTRRPDKFWHGEVVPIIEERARSKKKWSKRHRRLTNQRRWVFNKNEWQHVDHQRKVAHALLEEKVQCVIIGKSKTRLGLSQSEGTGDQHYGAQNTGYLFRLMLFIKEKAAERGAQVIEVADPRRKGNLQNPENKFHATREMLQKELEARGIPMPTSFFRKGFRFVYP